MRKYVVQIATAVAFLATLFATVRLGTWLDVVPPIVDSHLTFAHYIFLGVCFVLSGAASYIAGNVAEGQSLLEMHQNLKQGVIRTVLPLLTFGLLAVGVWLWPSNVLDTPLSGLTIKMLLQFAGVIAIGFVALVLLFVAFTRDALPRRDAILEELRQIESKTRSLIDEASQRGVTISTDQALKHVEELRDSYASSGNDAAAREVDRIIVKFREENGPEIPIEKAYSLIKKLEARHESL